MADDKEKAGSGILQALMTSLVGAISGAVVMYLSPLVTSAIKPPKPVPNFSYRLDGLTATFDNRSTGATQGWWDFGDDSALEAFSPNQASITHRFTKPGPYSVKLSLHNLIGEGEERAVRLKIDAQTAPPVLEDFQVTAVTSNRSRSSPYPSAPATFLVTGRAKNADLLIWSIDDQPLELVEAEAGVIKRYVNFVSYGTKKIRVMAIASKSKSKVEKEAEVFVDVPDDEPMVLIQQTSYAVTTKTMPVSISLPAKFNGASFPFKVSRPVEPDETIVAGVLDGVSDQLVRNPQLIIAADRKSFTVSGELLRQSGAVPASWFTKVELKVASHTAPGAKRLDPIAALLKLPGQTLVALPAAKDGMAAEIEWELRQGMDVVCKDTKALGAQLVSMNGKTYHVRVIPTAGQLQIDAVEAK